MSLESSKQIVRPLVDAHLRHDTEVAVQTVLRWHGHLFAPARAAAVPTLEPDPVIGRERVNISTFSFRNENVSAVTRLLYRYERTSRNTQRKPGRTSSPSSTSSAPTSRTSLSERYSTARALRGSMTQMKRTPASRYSPTLSRT